MFQKYGIKCTSSENISELATLFDSIDTNKTGYVNKDQLELFYSAMVDQAGLRGQKSKCYDIFSLIEYRRAYSKKEFIQGAINIKNIFEPEERTIKAIYKEIQHSWGNKAEDIPSMGDSDSDMAYVDFLKLMKSTA